MAQGYSLWSSRGLYCSEQILVLWHFSWVTHILILSKEVHHDLFHFAYKFIQIYYYSHSRYCFYLYISTLFEKEELKLIAFVLPTGTKTGSSFLVLRITSLISSPIWFLMFFAFPARELSSLMMVTVSSSSKTSPTIS